MASWWKGILTGLALFTYGLISMPNNFLQGSSYSGAQSRLENFLNLQGPSRYIKVDLDGSDIDNDGYYEFVSAKAFIEHSGAADTLNRTKFYNSDPEEDNFMDKVYIQNFPGAFKGDYSNYLGRVYANVFASYDFNSEHKDDYSFDYIRLTSTKNQQGETRVDTVEEDNLTREKIKDEFGKSQQKRVEKIVDLADGFNESDISKLKNFAGGEVQRYAIFR